MSINKTKKVSAKGLTIEKLTALGHKVRIRHFRYALYHAHWGEGGIKPIVVPSTFRRDPMYTLLPKGGFTHITIQTNRDVYYCLSSSCNEEDSFCYNTGIVTALDRLTEDDLATLGWND